MHPILWPCATENPSFYSSNSSSFHSPGSLQRLCLLPEPCPCPSSLKYQCSHHLLGGAFRTLQSGSSFFTQNSSRATPLFHSPLSPSATVPPFIPISLARPYVPGLEGVSCRTTANPQYPEQHHLMSGNICQWRSRPCPNHQSQHFPWP